MIDGSIPSPFSAATMPKEEFLKELNELCNKYGYWQWFVCVAEALGNEESNFLCAANVVSDGMVDALDRVSDSMQDMIDEETNS